jgi:hypothetical protein
MGTVNRARVQRLSTPVLPHVTRPYYTAVWSNIGKSEYLQRATTHPGSRCSGGTVLTNIVVNLRVSPSIATPTTRKDMQWILRLFSASLQATMMQRYTLRPGNRFPVIPTRRSSRMNLTSKIFTVFAYALRAASSDVGCPTEGSPKPYVHAHGSDVNVISWNRSTSLG